LIKRVLSVGGISLCWEALKSKVLNGFQGLLFQLSQVILNSFMEVSEFEGIWAMDNRLALGRGVHFWGKSFDI
jgi:hypothetical protein